uniref:hypothetical protein n=1 Tax=Ralstonia pseudosolanacearum TaxID=1310165 RepID=UPI001FF73929
MNTLTYTLIAYRPDGATNKSGHDIFVSRDWQEVVRRTAILLDQNARCETDQPWNYVSGLLRASLRTVAARVRTAPTSDSKAARP